MNFSYNENQKMIADMVQQFGKQHITPYVRGFGMIIRFFQLKYLKN